MSLEWRRSVSRQPVFCWEELLGACSNVANGAWNERAGKLLLRETNWLEGLRGLEGNLLGLPDGLEVVGGLVLCELGGEGRSLGLHVCLKVSAVNQFFDRGKISFN